MAEHKPGTMDISAQEKAFAGLMKMAMRVAIGVFVLLVFLALFNS